MSRRQRISSDDHYASLVCAIAAVVPSNCDGDCIDKIHEFLCQLGEALDVQNMVEIYTLTH